jgi:hypothetical protein
MVKRKRWDEVLARLPPPRSGRDVAMAEVGVWQGALSRRLLEARRDLMLTLVDPWIAGALNADWRESGSEMAQQDQAIVDGNYRLVCQLARPYIGRVQILRMTSLDAAAEIVNHGLDAVFLDGIHTYDAVNADIAAWQPKVRAGGWIGGHDYDAPRFPGVTRAVREQFPHAAIETGADKTWFVRL